MSQMDKRSEHRKRVVMEILEKQETFIAYMRRVELVRVCLRAISDDWQLFINPLLHGKQKGLIEPDWVHAMFSNIPAIAGVDQALLEYLQAECEKDKTNPLIGRALLKLVQQS